MSIWGAVALLLFSVGCNLSSALFVEPTREELSSENLHRFKTSHYYIENILEANYVTAQIFCKFHGMDLVSIETPEEDAFLKSTLEQKRRNNASWDWYWTSAHKLGEKWFWLGTGRYIDYFKWGPSEPNNLGGQERCINLIDKKGSVVWNDGDCNVGLYFICERNVTHFEQFCDVLSV